MITIKNETKNNMTAAFQYISQHRPGWGHSDVVRCACQAGVEWVQLRMKNVSRSKIIEEGRLVKELCLEYNAKFILNDHPFLEITNSNKLKLKDTFCYDLNTGRVIKEDLSGYTLSDISTNNLTILSQDVTNSKNVCLHY